MGTILRVLLAFWLGVLPALTARSADTERGRPFLEVFAPGDYRGHQQVFDVVQSSAGLIYLSNFGAVHEYDGAKWRNIPVPTQFIRKLAADPKGRIWVGGSEELGWCEPGADGTSVYHSLTARLPDACRPLGAVYTVEWHDDSVWFSTDRQVLRWHDGRFEHWEFPAGATPRLRPGGKHVWLSCRGESLRRWSGREWEVISRAPEIRDAWVNVIVEDWRDGRTLLGTSRGKLWTLGADGSLTPFAAEFSAAGVPLTAGARLRNGWLALTTHGRGVVVLDESGNLMLQVAAEDGLPSSSAYGLREDAEGGVWVGTSMGAARVELGSAYSFFGRGAGATATVALALKRSNGILYLGSEEGLRRLVPGPGSTARFEPVPDGGARVFSLLPHEDGMLAGTIAGLARVGEGRARLEVRLPSPVLGLGRSTSTPDRIFVGTPSAIATYRRTAAGEWIDEGKIAGFSGEAWTLEETAPGVLWAGTMEHGFARIRRGPGQTWQSAGVDYFRDSHGLPPKPGWVRVFQGPGGPWFTTAQGAFVFDPQRQAFDPVPAFAATKLAGLYTFPIGAVHAGEIWAQVAASAEPADLERATIGRLVHPPGQGWTWQPLPARILNKVGYFGAYEMAAEPGAVWLTGQNGLVRIETDRLATNETARPVRLLWRRIARGDLGALPLQGPVPDLPHSHLPLRFEFAQPAFAAGHTLEYAYRLQGYQATWSDWRTQPDLDLTGLPAGRFNLEIRARDQAGNEPPVLSYAFRMLGPWYLSPGLMLLYGVGALAAMAGVLRWRVAALQATASRLEQLVVRRTQDLADASQRAETANQAKSLFLANASHELRTPLHAILGYAQLLEDDRELSPAAHDRLRIVGASGRQLLRLINEILDLSKMEAGKVELRVDEFDLPALLAEIADAQENRALAKGLALRRPDPGALPARVRADAPKLRQVLENLLGNAIKFTPAGEVALAVSPLGAERIRFEVTDTGPGIAAPDLARIFQPFQQAGSQPPTAEAGTGLGLAITQRLVNLMGGTVQVASEVGRGSRFWFELVLPAAEPTAAAGPTSLAPAPDMRGHGRLILVVDDLAVNRELLRASLEPVGYAVEEAATAEAALAALARGTFDLMIVDLRLPGMGGLDLVRRLRDAPATVRLPVIAASASAVDQDPELALLAGCSDFIAKPFLREDLLRRVSRLLDPGSAPAADQRAAPTAVPLELAAVQAMHNAALEGDVVRLRTEIRHLREKGVTDPLLEELSRRAQAFDVDGAACLTDARLQAARRKA